MQQLKSLLKSQKTWIVLLLILTGVFFYIRSVNRNLISDEIVYFYVFNEDKVLDSKTEFREITTFSDVLESQINHYKVVNGRAIVHTIEQIFSGIIGLEVFYILNVCVFLFVVYLIVKMFLNKHKYSHWLFTIIVLLYLFSEQSNLWISINYSLNYLWPLCVTLLTLYFWNELRLGKKLSQITLILLPLLGLVTGWSNEALAVPLSSTIFMYYCINYRKFSSKIALLILPLWIGTAFLVLAPGNFVRMQRDAFVSTGNDLVFNLVCERLLLILIILFLLFVVLNKIKIKEFIRNNNIYIGLFIVSFIFVLALGLMPGRTYISVELYSFILIIKLLSGIKTKFSSFFYIEKFCCVIITLLFILNQSFICDATIKEKSKQDNFLNQYVTSKDGIAVYDRADYGFCVNPYVRKFSLEIGDNYFIKSLELKHTRRTKRLVPCSSKDYYFISNYNSLVESNKNLKFSGPFYAINGGEYAWAIKDSVQEKSFEYICSSENMHKDADSSLNKAYIERIPVKKMVEVNLDSRKFLAIKIPPMRNVVDIKGVN